jgi:hypothetical protein
MRYSCCAVTIVVIAAEASAFQALSAITILSCARAWDVPLCPSGFLAGMSAGARVTECDVLRDIHVRMYIFVHFTIQYPPDDPTCSYYSSAWRLLTALFRLAGCCLSACACCFCAFSKNSAKTKCPFDQQVYRRRAHGGGG